MKAAIIGYGKMGREIERILTERGHEAALIIDTDNAHELDAAHLAGIDVALEFTTPETAYRNIRTCIECGVAAVSGTTGWTDRLGELQELCRERGGALFYASNYCLGVNLMFRLNRQLAAMIDRVGGYDVRIEEVHHTQKKDAPSGTAITLAEGIAENLAGKQGWVNLAPGIEHAANRIERSGEAPADRIEIRLQDWLDLGAGHRMNIPGTSRGNWEWRMLPGEASKKLAGQIREMTRIYGRS